MIYGLTLILLNVLIIQILPVKSFNGDDFELECPDECDCHYFRINWVTDCSESNLTTIPYSELSKSVYILDLNGNNITTVDGFPNDIKMRRIQLANNRINNINKNAFANLDYLIDVDLSGNNISYVHPAAFIHSRALLNLEIQNNPLRYIDGPFLVSSTLQLLDMSSCDITVINPNFFDNITSLTSLDLSGNPLQVLEAGTFDVLTVLETLKLNDCKLSAISEDTFISNVNLKTLELASNYLSDTEWSDILGPLEKLQYLNLRKANINNLSENSFANNTYLETLILAENELFDLDVATTLGNNLENLDVLDLSNCHMKGPLSGHAFANSTKLKTLYLSGNPLFAPDLREALQPLPKLESLFLSNCGLRSLPVTINTYTNLKQLDISYNPLVNVFTRLLAPLENLEYLNMGYSNLSYISPETFAQMNSLKRLVLSGNDLNSLEAGLFGNLTQLTTLEIEFCGLKRTLNANAFFKNFTYPYLRELKISGNPLIIPTKGPILTKQFSLLTKLDINNCNITALNSEAFKLTPNLTELNLSGNKINSCPGSLSFIRILENLEKLDISNNNLTTLSPDIFENNYKLQTLNLVGNPFICNCKIAEMWDWANMIKGDLDILVGAKIAAQDIALKGTKKKKSLLCHYDEKQLKNLTIIQKTVVGRRPFNKPRELNLFNRTWAKYVRESGCEPMVKILRPAALVAEDMYIYQPPVNFLTTTIVLAISTILFITLLIWMVIRLKNKSNIIVQNHELHHKAR